MKPSLDLLRMSRLRLTSGRLFVLQAIQSSAHERPRVEEIFRQLVSNGTPLSVGSVYRVLRDLTREGILVRQWERTSDEQRFSYWLRADAEAAGNGCRFSCSRCSSTVLVQDHGLQAQLRQAAQDAGLALAEAGGVTVQVVCAECAKAGQA
jgi:Fe2+ or Zn2+ uptake regulation protein